MIVARKINKFPEFYTIFARKNIFPDFFWGGVPPSSPTPMNLKYFCCLVLYCNNWYDVGEAVSCDNACQFLAIDHHHLAHDPLTYFHLWVKPSTPEKYSPGSKPERGQACLCTLVCLTLPSVRSPSLSLP